METKLREALAEAEREAVRYRRIADNLKALLGKSAPVKRQGKSLLVTALEVMKEKGKPIHLKELVEIVSKKRGLQASRGSLESVLATAAKDKKLGIKRVAPGTFELREKA